MPNSIVVDISLDELHKSLELDKVLKYVLDAVCNELGFAFATISLIDEDRQETYNADGRNVLPGWLKDAHHPLDSDDIQAYILRTGNTVSIGEKEVEKVASSNGKTVPEASINGKTVPLVGDKFCFDGEYFKLDWPMYKKYKHYELVRVWAALGQQLPDGPIGTIEVGFYREEHQTILPILVNMLESYAAEATVAIQRALLYEQEQRHARMLTKLHNVSSHLQTQSQKEDDEPLLSQQIAEAALRLLEADVVTLYPLEQSSLDDQAEPCFTEPISDLKGSGEIALPYSPGNLVKTVAENRKSDYRPDPQDARDPVEYSNDSVCSFAAVPLQSGGELLGVLCIGYRMRHQFSEYARQIIELFAQQAAVVIKLERSQRELRRQKEYFEGLVLHSPVAIAALDLDRNVVSWNPAAEELFGYTQDEACGHSIYELVTKTPEMYEEASNITREMEVSREPQVHSGTRRSRKDGTPVDVDLLVTPAMVGGERVGTFAMYHDITKLLHARQQAEAAYQQAEAARQQAEHASQPRQLTRRRPGS